MELRTYYDFALNDYEFLCELKKNGITARRLRKRTSPPAMKL